jgi:mannose-6-phosphate isomerase-like protein (cupin superfamily)
MIAEINKHIMEAKLSVKRTSDIIQHTCKDHFLMDTSEGTKVEILKLLADSEAGVFYSTQNMGSITELHMHDESIEYFIVVTGAIKCDGVIYNEGECCKVEPKTIHSVEAISNCKYINITLPMEYAFMHEW